MARNNLRIRILLPLSILSLLLLASFLVSAYNIKRDNINTLLNRQHGITMSSFKEILDYKSSLMAAISHALLLDPVLTHTFIHANREGLAAHIRLYKPNLLSNQITYCSFHTAEGVNMFRLHNPEHFGDYVSSYTLEKAMKTGQAMQGIQLGALGHLTLRLVTPWIVNGQLIGYLELGIDLHHILDRLSLMNNIEYMITLQKELIDKNLLDEELSDFIASQGWDCMPDKVVTATSLEKIPKELRQVLSRTGIIQTAPDRFLRTRLYNRQFAYKIFPFREGSGRQIGSFVLLYDITAQSKSFYQLMTSAVILSILACLGLFMVAWRILGKTQRLIDSSQQQLLEQIQAIKETNSLLEEEMSVRKQAETDLATLNRELEQRIELRTSHLAQANQQIEQKRLELEQAYNELQSRQAMIMHQDKMASIGVLAAGVAHDINNPMGYISNNLEELQIYLQRMQDYIQGQQEQIEASGDELALLQMHKLKEQLGIEYIYQDFGTLIAESQDGINRVSELVKNLRNFSRIDDMAMKVADIHDCIESAIRITNHELRYKVVLHREYSQDIPRIFCRPQQLNQVFMNLLINAVQAIEKHGEITIGTRLENRSITIEITDSGCGIPQAVKNRIFDPFFTTKESNIGTGLGLAIVSEIISLHNGTISVESQEGTGSTFTIRLPVTEGDRDA